MKGEASERGAFAPYPTNRVVGTIHAAPEAQAAIQALLQAGFERDDVDVLHGESDVRRLDPTGTAHGFLAQFQRALMRTASVEEYDHLQHHAEDVRAGRFVLMVRAKGGDRRHLAADILNSHGATSVGFYGRWAWESLAGNGKAADPAPGRTYESSIAGSGPVRIHYNSPNTATITTGIDAGGATLQAAVTPVRAGVTMLSWHDAKNVLTVQVHDYEHGNAYAVLPDGGAGVRHHAGTLRRIS